MNTWIWIAAFFAMAITDIAWALYTAQIADKRPLGAAAWSVLIVLVGGVNTLAIVHDPRYLTATSLGAFAGTYTGVWWARRSSKETTA